MLIRLDPLGLIPTIKLECEEKSNYYDNQFQNNREPILLPDVLS
jgi:hypothetical protein